MKLPGYNALLAGLVGFAFLLILFFNLADVQASYTNCIAIEDLKKAELTAAETSYARLDASLKLLNIPKTPEVVKISEENLAFARSNFSPQNCKRFYIPFVNEKERTGPTQLPPPPATTVTTNP